MEIHIIVYNSCKVYKNLFNKLFVTTQKKQNQIITNQRFFYRNITVKST